MIIKILVVDDEKLTVSHNERLFNTDGQIRVLTAYSAVEAMEVIKREKPCIIILDIKMGPFADRSGLELLEKLRKTDKTTEVIIGSAIDDEDDMDRAEALGITAYLKKPYELLTLRDEVEKILVRKGLR